MGIPSIDLSVLVGAPSQRRTEVLGAFLRSCASHGFVKVVGHGISDIRLRQLFAWVLFTMRICAAEEDD